MQYITGPAIVRRGGISLYSQDGIKLDFKSKTGKVPSDLHGKEIDTYLISRTGLISFKPVDAIANLSALFALGIGNIGQSIFAATVRNYSSVSVANPGVMTFAAAHNLGPAGTTIAGTIAGEAAAVPALNGPVILTVTDATHATVADNTGENIDVTTAGTGGTFVPVSEPLQIVSKNDAAIYTFERAGQTKCPNLHLGAGKGVFSSALEFTALGSYTKEPTDPAAWLSTVAQAFADTTFDETTIKRYRYTAAYGDAPYAAMTGQNGFDLNINYGTSEIPDDNVGIGDIALDNVTATAKFTPSNLTQAQLLTLLNLQGENAILPGESFAADGSVPLVIAGTDGSTTFTVSLNGAGFQDSALLYQTGKLRFGELMAMSKRTWAEGAPNSLFTMEIS